MNYNCIVADDKWRVARFGWTLLTYLQGDIGHYQLSYMCFADQAVLVHILVHRWNVGLLEIISKKLLEYSDMKNRVRVIAIPEGD